MQQKVLDSGDGVGRWRAQEKMTAEAAAVPSAMRMG
jgi:hypothetical protein